MKFKVEIERKIRDLSEDNKLVGVFDLELEELKKRHYERINKNQPKKEDQIDHVKKNRFVASEWFHIQREQIKSRQDTTAERYSIIPYVFLI